MLPTMTLSRACWCGKNSTKILAKLLNAVAVRLCPFQSWYFIFSCLSYAQTHYATRGNVAPDADEKFKGSILLNSVTDVYIGKQTDTMMSSVAEGANGEK